MRGRQVCRLNLYRFRRHSQKCLAKSINRLAVILLGRACRCCRLCRLLYGRRQRELLFRSLDKRSQNHFAKWLGKPPQNTALRVCQARRHRGLHHKNHHPRSPRLLPHLHLSYRRERQKQSAQWLHRRHCSLFR